MNDKEFQTAIGKTIKQLRLGENISQLDLALEVNVNVRTIQWIESYNGNPGAETLNRISKALDIKLSDLIKKAGY